MNEFEDWRRVCDSLPNYGGVYSVWARGQLLYIGMAKNISARFRHHTHLWQFEAEQADEIRFMRIDVYFDRAETEAFLISHWNPKFNVRQRKRSVLHFVKEAKRLTEKLIWPQ